MTLQFRPYEDADLPRLQDALAAWTAEAGPCGYCHAGDLASRIYEGLHGRGPLEELVRVWEDDAGIAGVAICLRFGVAFDVFAGPAHRGTVSELEMLRVAFETTRSRMSPASGSAAAWVVTDVFDCDRERAGMLDDLGFEKYQRFDHVNERSLRLAIPRAKVPDGFLIRSATMDDADQLAAIRNAAFGATWSGDAFRDQVMRKPGYDPERELVVVASGQQVVAFTVIWVDHRNRVGLFEPVGTHPDFRRLGLARAVVLQGLREMWRLGMDVATVEHDERNLAARNLYLGLGFEKRYETFGFRRSAEARKGL